jgi:zinc protease
MKIIRLDNGLRCILEQRKDSGVVAIQVWVRVGSRYEDDRVAGVTHFIEHLIFKGTEKGEGYEIAPRIEALGGSINAFTSYDNTVYHIVIPADAFETGFELLTESVKSPSFPEKELEKEKKVVIEEIKMGEDDPQRKLFRELFGASYPGHPYGRPIIGYAESVSAMTRSDVLSYYADHYGPDNMSIVVVGDFDEGKAEELLRRQFSGVPGKGKTTEGSTAPGEENRARIVEKNVAESYLTISYPIGSFTHPDTPALEVLSKILTDGDSSRLQSTLKHAKRLVTDADTYLFAPAGKGLFVIMATFRGKDHEAVRRNIQEELDCLSKNGLEQWEIEKAKNLVRASYVYGEETVQGRARLVGNCDTLTEDPGYTEKYLAAIEKVDEADVRRVLDSYLGEGVASIAVLVPKKASNPREIVLGNGMRCAFNHNTASPSFAFMIGFVGGLKEEKPGQNGIFTVLSRMLLRGTRDLDAQAIAKRIDTLAGSLSPVSGRNVFGLSGKFLSKDADEALGLLKTLLTETVIREEELAKVKEEVLSELRRRDDEAVQYTFTWLNRELYAGHPYAADQVGTPGDVAGLTKADLDGLYGGYVSPGGAVLALSGDMEPARAEDLVRTLFLDWKGPGHTLRKHTHELASGREKIVEREMLQTHLIFGFPGPGLIADDRYPVEVMNAILSGMGGRIHRKLREENPFAYAVTFFNQETYETGAVGIYIGTDRTHMADVERIAREEIGKMREEGFSEEEVETAKRYMIGNHYIRMQTNGAMASSMCLDAIYGLTPGFFKVWPKQAERVTKEQVDEAVRKYLILDRMVKIAVGPVTGKG